MQKIVIVEYYYFWIPYETLARYFELSGLDGPFLYNHDYRKDPETGKDVQFSFKVNQEGYDVGTMIYKKDIGDSPDSDEMFGEYYGYCLDFGKIARDDKNLIKAVEETNSKPLKIVEIPDGVKWYVSQDDGCYEIIEEEHRIWS